jgi:hypothetical protein
MFRLIAIDFSQKSPHFFLLSPTSPCELFEREVTYPSNLKVVRALNNYSLVFVIFINFSGQLKDWVGQVLFLVSCLKGQVEKYVNVEAWYVKYFFYNLPYLISCNIYLYVLIEITPFEAKPIRLYQVVHKRYYCVFKIVLVWKIFLNFHDYSMCKYIFLLIYCNIIWTLFFTHKLCIKRAVPYCSAKHFTWCTTFLNYLTPV